MVFRGKREDIRTQESLAFPGNKVSFSRAHQCGSQQLRGLFASTFTAIKQNLKCSVALMQATFHWSHVTSDCHIGQRRYRAFPLSQKVLPDSTGQEDSYQVSEGLELIRIC